MKHALAVKDTPGWQCVKLSTLYRVLVVKQDLLQEWS